MIKPKFLLEGDDMYTLLGIIFSGIGLLMVVNPSIIFQITESWKSDITNEPSELFKISTRVGGGAFIIIGIASIVLL